MNLWSAKNEPMLFISSKYISVHSSSSSYIQILEVKQYVLFSKKVNFHTSKTSDF